MHKINRQDNRQREILRVKVLRVIESTNKQLSGREIARRARLEYKQTIDALDALYNTGRVQRYGKKFLTMWGRIQPADNHSAIKILNDAFDTMTKSRSN